MQQLLHFLGDDLRKLAGDYRRELINTLAGFKSANLLGTVSPEGVTNLAVFNSVVHIGANPPLMGFILRPLTVPRHTYQNIKATGHYTFNHVGKEMIGAAHHTAAKYPEGTSEFEAANLTPYFSEEHPAPYVQESTIKVGLRYAEEHKIQANGTLLVVGEVVELMLPADVVGEDGFIDLPKASTVAISGLDAYYEAQQLGRFPYARPKK